MSQKKGTTTTQETTSERRRTGKRAEPKNLTKTTAPSNLTAQTKELTPTHHHAARLIPALLADPNTDADTRELTAERLIEFANTAGVNLDHPDIAGAAYLASLRRLERLNKRDRATAVRQHGDLLALVEQQPAPPDTTAADTKQKFRDALAANPLDAPLPSYGEPVITDEEREQYRREGEYFARLLHHPDTPKAFVTAFGAVYVDTMLDRGRVVITDPRVLRHAHAGVMEQLHHNAGVDADALMYALMCLAETLVPDSVSEPIHRAIFGAETGGAE